MLRHRSCRRSCAVSSVLAICVLVQLAPPLLAQSTATGTLRGTVTGASGRVIANAVVTATRIDTEQTQKATTGADGAFKLDLPPGNYRVKFEATGFKAMEIPSA